MLIATLQFFKIPFLEITYCDTLHWQSWITHVRRHIIQAVKVNRDGIISVKNFLSLQIT